MDESDSSTVVFVAGRPVLIDQSVSEWFEPLEWSYSGHYVRSLNDKNVLLHRFLIGAPDGAFVDHVNGDKLDNRLCNLRVCTHAENMRNRKVHKNNKLGVKGVYLETRTGRTPKYVVQIAVAGKKINLGRFDSLSAAKNAYKSASLKYHGEFARQT